MRKGKHAMRGRRMGRSFEHFFAEGIQLANEADLDDPYLERAYTALVGGGDAFASPEEELDF